MITLIGERMQRAISVETVVRVFLNPQGRVNAANHTFLRTSRYSRDELEQEEMRWLEMTPPKFALIFVDVLTVRVQPKTLQSPPESANRYERQGHAKNSPQRAKHREGEHDGGRSE